VSDSDKILQTAQKVSDLFAKALSRPTSSFVVSDEEAEKIVGLRQGRLAKFATDDNPAPLRDKFESGMVLTTACHKLGHTLKLLFDEISGGSVANPQNLLTVALNIMLQERQVRKQQFDPTSTVST
jgi:hypothetical protein